MKRYKLIDFWISAILIILGLIVIVFYLEDSANENEITVLFCCLFWGMWQVLSMIIHLFDRRNWKYFLIRFSYTLLAAVVLIYSLSLKIDEYNHTYFLPIMAVFYTGLCGFEVFTKVKQNAP